MAIIIQSLWIGESLGPLERLSLASFLHFGHEYHLYCYQPIANVPPGIILKDARAIFPESAIFRYQQGPGKGSVAAFANLFRYKLLLERGGWWTDTDVVCVRPWDFPEESVFAGQVAKIGFQVNSCVMKVPAGDRVARTCYTEAAALEPSTLHWGTTGPVLLTLVVLEAGQESLVRAPPVFCPVPWWDWKMLLSPDWASCEKLLTPATRGIHLWHEMWRREGLDRKDAVPASSLLGRLWYHFHKGTAPT